MILKFFILTLDEEIFNLYLGLSIAPFIVKSAFTIPPISGLDKIFCNFAKSILLCLFLIPKVFSFKLTPPVNPNISPYFLSIISKPLIEAIPSE